MELGFVTISVILLLTVRRSITEVLQKPINFNLFSAYRFPSFRREDHGSFLSPGLGMENYYLNNKNLWMGKFGLKDSKKNFEAFLTYVHSSGFGTERIRRSPWSLSSGCHNSVSLPPKEQWRTVQPRAKYLVQAGDPYNIRPSFCSHSGYGAYVYWVSMYSVAVGKARSQILYAQPGEQNCTRQEEDQEDPEDRVWRLSCLPWILHKSDIKNVDTANDKERMDSLFSIDRAPSSVQDSDYLHGIEVDPNPRLDGQMNPLSLGATFINTIDSYVENVINVDTLRSPTDTRRNHSRPWTFDDLIGSNGVVQEKRWEDANLQIKIRKIPLDPEVPCSCCRVTHSHSQKVYCQGCKRSHVPYRNHCFLEKINRWRSVRFSETIGKKPLEKLTAEERGWRELDAWLDAELRIPCFSTLIHSSQNLQNVVKNLSLQIDINGIHRNVSWDEADTIGLYAGNTEICKEGSKEWDRTCEALRQKTSKIHSSDEAIAKEFAIMLKKEGIQLEKIFLEKKKQTSPVSKGSSYNVSFAGADDTFMIRWTHGASAVLRNYERGKPHGEFKFRNNLYIIGLNDHHLSNYTAEAYKPVDGFDWRKHPDIRRIFLTLKEDKHPRDYYRTPVIITVAILVTFVAVGVIIYYYTKPTPEVQLRRRMKRIRKERRAWIQKGMEKKNNTDISESKTTT